MDLENWEFDPVDQLLRESDEKLMALPDIGLEPHLLISKVRKHYMEYVVKLLSVNYETNQKLLNKNIYLPSAIWRCAKNIETNAAQACMVVQLYRKNIIPVINELKNDTKKGKLNRKLYDCLNKPPPNDKKIQTHIKVKENSCQCVLSKRKRRQGNSMSPKNYLNHSSELYNGYNTYNDNCNAPVAVSTTQHPNNCNIGINTPHHFSNFNNLNIPVVNDTLHMPKIQSQQIGKIPDPPMTSLPQLNHQVSVESDQDELMMQLEKLFHDQNDDDIFEGALCDRLDTPLDDHAKRVSNVTLETTKINSTQDAVIENHAAQIKSLDERLASLTGLLVANNTNAVNTKTDSNQRPKRSGSGKWLCEEFYLKQKLYEVLDHIGDTNRKSLEKIKEKFVYYFGYDSDDEGVLSPLEETPEFVVSCKERIAPWVVKILTPYYIKGHIKGKGVFKCLAKHLIRLIYQCSKYPEEYEVTSFVSDFLKNHRTIRCEADFKEFKIENI